VQSNHHAIIYYVSDITETPFDIDLLRSVSEVREFVAQKFSIGEVRELIGVAYGRPLELPTRTIIVRALDIGSEAQHALLKVLEEPPLTTHIILILKQGCFLLPTLLSRLSVQVPNTPVEKTGELVSVFSDFKAASLTDRLALIAAFTKDKDTETAEALEQGLIRYIGLHPQRSSEELRRLVWCQSHLRMHGASRKMLWEEIALTIPVEDTRGQ
jgi:DNA polymerase III, delta subunit